MTGCIFPNCKGGLECPLAEPPEKCKLDADFGTPRPRIKKKTADMKAYQKAYQKKYRKEHEEEIRAQRKEYYHKVYKYVLAEKRKTKQEGA